MTAELEKQYREVLADYHLEIGPDAMEGRHVHKDNPSQFAYQLLYGSMYSIPLPYGGELVTLNETGEPSRITLRAGSTLAFEGNSAYQFVFIKSLTFISAQTR